MPVSAINIFAALMGIKTITSLIFAVTIAGLIYLLFKITNGSDEGDKS
jgi:hypothetical protein